MKFYHFIINEWRRKSQHLLSCLLLTMFYALAYLPAAAAVDEKAGGDNGIKSGGVELFDVFTQSCTEKNLSPISIVNSHFPP